MRIVVATGLLLALSAPQGRAEEPMVLTPPGLGGQSATPAAPLDLAPQTNKPVKPRKPPAKPKKPSVAAAPSPADKQGDGNGDVTSATSASPIPDFNAATDSLPSAIPAPSGSSGPLGIDDPAVELAPSADGSQPDLAYGAFQRGFYLTAFQLALELAEKGDTPAQTLIGLIYEGGYGVPRNYKEAAGWYRLAAKGGDREAAFALGMMYLEGRGVTADGATAMTYLDEAGAKGHIGAIYQLALAHLGGKIRPLDPSHAAGLLARAAKAGYAEAQYELASLYADGHGVPEDQALATEWFSTAARLGYVPAEIDYAIRLFNGVGTAKDEAAARDWFERAADAGNPIAQNRLARLLAASSGGTSPGAIEAAKWHYLAKDAGKDDGWLDNFVDSLTDDQRREAVAAAQRWSD